MEELKIWAISSELRPGPLNEGLCTGICCCRATPARPPGLATALVAAGPAAQAGTRQGTATVHTTGRTMIKEDQCGTVQPVLHTRVVIVPSTLRTNARGATLVHALKHELLAAESTLLIFLMVATLLLHGSCQGPL